MSSEDSLILTDYAGRRIRLTRERQTHILDHPEMAGQLDRVQTTLLEPEAIVATVVDETVLVYHRFYSTTPVTSKYLLVAVKLLPDDAFVLAAFYSKRRKKGRLIWQA